MRSNVYQPLKAAASGVTVNGPAIKADQVVAFSVQAVSTGVAVGAVKVQFSNDLADGLSHDANGQPIPIHWTDVTSATVAIPSAGTYGIVKFDSAYEWLRVVYTYTSGAAGTITANIFTFGF